MTCRVLGKHSHRPKRVHTIFPAFSVTVCVWWYVLRPPLWAFQLAHNARDTQKMCHKIEHYYRSGVCVCVCLRLYIV